MTIEEFRAQKEAHDKAQRIKRRELINKVKEAQRQLDDLNKNVPVRDGECYCCLDATEEELNCGHLFCDKCRGEEDVVECGICRATTEYEVLP